MNEYPSYLPHVCRSYFLLSIWQKPLLKKTVSLLRRSHWNWFGNQQSTLDPTLVRHVYDVYQILRSHPDIASRSAQIFEDLVEGDRTEFSGRDSGFDQDPRGSMMRTLEFGRNHVDWKENYQKRLTPLIYADHIPSFSEAFSVFDQVAHTLVGGLPLAPPKSSIFLGNKFLS
jgi:hypothetical protein